MRSRSCLGRTRLASCLALRIAPDHPALIVSMPVRLTRSGRVLRLVQPGGRAAAEVPANSSLVRLLAQARDWNARLRAGRS